MVGGKGCFDIYFQKRVGSRQWVLVIFGVEGKVLVFKIQMDSR